jgi:8-oxo-dGTP diphosphatase
MGGSGSFSNAKAEADTGDAFMKDWQAAPIFGERSESVRYTLRPGAYVLLEDGRGQLALVRTPQGVFLPGGGIEANETPQQAATREVLEECGLVVRVGHWETWAVQFCYSESEKIYFEKRCTFIDAVVESVASKTEADHELLWVASATAPELMTHESQRWAIEVWRSRTAG